jgi:4-amino-4-deoxy-L-arabinose transferase-like glycosyltransferase
MVKRLLASTPLAAYRLLFAVCVITLLALALRVAGLGDVPLRWDEGWSVAHASLNGVDLLTITAADVHPPLFYLVLGLWQQLVGVNLFADRYLAVLTSLPTIPLTFAVARVWTRGAGRCFDGSTRLALIAAALMAWLPLAVYYSAVIRMYALAPTFLLLCAWAALQMSHDVPRERRRRIGVIIAFVVGAAGAMYTLYHAAWALLALGLYVLGASVLQRVQVRAHLVMLGVAVVLGLLAYAPWAAYALPQLQQRAAAESANISTQYPLSYFLKLGIDDLAFTQWTGWPGLAVLGLIVAGGLVGWALGLRRRSAERSRSNIASLLTLVLPVLMIAFTLVGVSAAAQRWAFNARMLIGAAPALVLLMAWSLDQWARHSHPLAGAVCLVLIGVYWTTSATFVYQKTLEVFDPYDPHTYMAHLAPQGRPTDIAFFNVLSPAGFYALDRQAGSPSWSYALTWDPVIEPFERWQARITQAAQTHPRLWLVLYRGLAGKNGDLRGWMDTHFFPAAAEWGEEGVFYGLYGAGEGTLVDGAGANTRWSQDGAELALEKVQLPLRAYPGDIIPVALTWRALAPLKLADKIFVHAFDEQGALIAQHDAQPLNDLRPLPSLPTGDDVLDHHGLALPADFRGTLRIVVGVYDPGNNVRRKTAQGAEEIEIGRVVVSAP